MAQAYNLIEHVHKGSVINLLEAIVYPDQDELLPVIMEVNQENLTASLNFSRIIKHPPDNSKENTYQSLDY